VARLLLVASLLILGYDATASSNRPQPLLFDTCPKIVNKCVEQSTEGMYSLRVPEQFQYKLAVMAYKVLHTFVKLFERSTLDVRRIIQISPLEYSLTAYYYMQFNC